MARAIWKGTITFGLVTVPIGLYTAVGREDEKLDLHLLHDKDGARIHYDRVCDKGHRDIDWDEIVKGYEYTKGKWVTLSKEELAALDLESLRTIEVVSFAPEDQIDPILYNRTYYTVPEEPALKAYKLVIQVLEDEGLVGLCKVALREREHMAALRVMDGMLVMQTMHWPEEIRSANFPALRKHARVSENERKMARQLIRQLTADFDPNQFKDEYHKALKKLIRRKVKGQEIVVPPEPEEPETVIDLMEALRASVDATRSGKDERRLRRGSRRRGKGETSDLKELTRDELYEKAQDLDIEGRSQMGKRQLLEAIRKSA